MSAPPLHGGDARVWRADRVADAATVAVKVHHDAAVAAAERAILERLDRDDVARLLDVIDLDGTSALVTGWVVGRSMAEVIDNAPLPRPRLVDLADQLATALDGVHAAGVVHGDLGARNVLVSPDDEVTLIDFGQGHRSDVTARADTTAWTLRYVAPEVAAGATPGPAADRYGFATIVYELLTGRSPFPATDQPATLLHQQLHATPTPPSEIDPYLPVAVDAVLEQALAKDPGHRPASADEIVRELVAALRPVPAAPERARWPIVAAAAAVPAVIAAVVVGAILVRSGDEPAADLVARLDPGPDLVAGTAGGLACNTLTGHGFDDFVLPESWFIELADRNDVIAGVGLDGTAGLVVGTGDGYSLYGERVPASPGSAYAFSAWLDVGSTVEETSMRVSWLDEAFEPLDGDAEFAITDHGRGRLTLRTPPAPDGTRWLVAVIGKSESVGVVAADELVVADRSDPCVDQLVGG